MRFSVSKKIFLFFITQTALAALIGLLVINCLAVLYKCIFKLLKI